MNIPTSPTATHTRMRFTVQGFPGFFRLLGLLWPLLALLLRRFHGGRQNLDSCFFFSSIFSPCGAIYMITLPGILSNPL